MLLPSLTAQRAARSMLQRAAEEFQPATITISGVPVRVAGMLGPLRRPFAEEGGGTNLVRTFTFTASKLAIPTAPTPNVTTFTHEGLTFTVRQVAGHDTHLPSWHVVASRTALPSEV